MKKSLSNSLIAVAVMLFIFSVNIFSQPVTVWSKAYNGPSNLQDSAIGISVNSNGNVFVTGWSLGTGTSADIVTVRYNPVTGDTIWVNRYSGPTNLEDKVSAITSDNNAVYVTGWSFVPSRDIITIKYDAATGNRLWVKTYNGIGNGGDYGLAITVDGSGNVYSAGRSDVGGSQKFTILKYDASGNMVSGWPCVYTGGLSAAFDQVNAITVDGSGNVFAGGKSGTGSAGGFNYLTIGIHSGGTVNWAKKYNGTLNNDDVINAIILDNSAANVIVSGYSFKFQGNQDYMTIKYAASTGDSVAAASYNGPAASIDIATAMTKDANNNIYITGYSTSLTTGYDYATIKYNSGLTQQWVQRTTDAGSDFSCSIAYDNASNNVFVTGSSIGSGTGYDYLTIAYTTNGNFKWQIRENGSASGNDFASGIYVQDTNKIFVTGTASFSGTPSNFYTLRYDMFNSVEPVSNQVPLNYNIQQNYPNPFNPVTSIRFDIPKSSFVKISVYDILGREIENLVNGTLTAGEYKVNWNASGFASGIYFYSISANGYSKTMKMILTK
ncbi:MAG: T9SS type A sorting domain-containing protein [Ignavibacteria bacterium]|nr:T9SS type A sorting domain-containing protein [Ignavibacteria bacterium]